MDFSKILVLLRSTRFQFRDKLDTIKYASNPIGTIVLYTQKKKNHITVNVPFSIVADHLLFCFGGTSVQERPKISVL